MGQEGEKCHQQRGGQGDSDQQAGAELGHHGPPAVPPGSGHPDHRPPRHEDPVDEGGLGEAGQNRQGEGDAEQPPTAPPSFPGGGQRPFDPEQRQRKQEDGSDGCVGQPGVRTTQSEGDTPGDRERPPHPQPSNQPIGRPPGGRLEEDLEVEHPLVKQQQDGGEEERPALHLAGQRRPDAFVGVPPRDVTMEPVEGDQVTQRLGGEARIGIDVGTAGQPGALARAQIGVDGLGVAGDQVQQAGKIGEQDGDEDADEREDLVRSPIDVLEEPQPGGAEYRSRVLCWHAVCSSPVTRAMILATGFGVGHSVSAYDAPVVLFEHGHRRPGNAVPVPGGQPMTAVQIGIAGFGPAEP